MNTHIHTQLECTSIDIFIREGKNIRKTSFIAKRKMFDVSLNRREIHLLDTRSE